MSAELEGAFPNLAADGYTVASPKTQAYNCVAWAAGDASRWWEPGIYWPGPTGDDLAALTGLFAALGYVPCAGDELMETRRGGGHFRNDHAGGCGRNWRAQTASSPLRRG